WAPQHASIATIQLGSLAKSVATPSRATRRRSTTAPALSNPTTPQLFFPRSIPRTDIADIPPSSRKRRPYRGSPHGGAGHSIITSHSRARRPKTRFYPGQLRPRLGTPYLARSRV